MDKEKKRQLTMAYKTRKPDMGIISLQCTATGESFLGASKDIPADFNSIRVKLNSGFHPNKRLLELWKEYGEKGFEFTIIEKLKVEDPTEDYTDDLELMREYHLENNPKAKKIWR